MSACILFPKDNTISSWAQGGYLKSTRRLRRWANGCGQDFGQLKSEQLDAHPGNYDLALTAYAYGKEIQMSEVRIATASPEKMVLAVISHLNKGEIDDALALFADQFSFKDHGIGLEFNAKDRLAEFFRKARELYPDTLVRTETIFVSGQHALTEWTVQATLIEPAFGNWGQKVPISLHGASVVRTENGRITSWSDYLTVSFPGGPRWRHISQSGSNTEVFDYRSLLLTLKTMLYEK